MTQRALDEFERVKREMFDEGVAKLPQIDRPAQYPQEVCKSRNHDGYVCSKAKDHDGDHVAHGMFAHVCARWSQ